MSDPLDTEVEVFVRKIAWARAGVTRAQSLERLAPRPAINPSPGRTHQEAHVAQTAPQWRQPDGAVMPGVLLQIRHSRSS